jgi:hypothetical protein
MEFRKFPRVLPPSFAINVYPRFLIRLLPHGFDKLPQSSALSECLRLVFALFRRSFRASANISANLSAVEIRAQDMPNSNDRQVNICNIPPVRKCRHRTAPITKVIQWQFAGAQNLGGE